MIDGSAQEVIAEASCGFCVPAGDVEGLASAMKEYVFHFEKYRDQGENGRQYFKEHFRKPIFMQRLKEEFERIRRD